MYEAYLGDSETVAGVATGLVYSAKTRVDQALPREPVSIRRRRVCSPRSRAGTHGAPGGAPHCSPRGPTSDCVVLVPLLLRARPFVQHLQPEPWKCIREATGVNGASTKKIGELGRVGDRSAGLGSGVSGLGKTDREATRAE